MSARPIQNAVLLGALLLPAFLLPGCRRDAPDPAPASGTAVTATPEEARKIARDAYVYGYPMVEMYRIIHAYSIDKANPLYRGPFNTLLNFDRVFTPDDTAIVTPNADTPYTLANLDLRREPVVLSVPQMDPKRYFVFQLIDLYTFNFDYIGSRATGSGGGHFLIAGPDWEGQPPPGIDKVIRSETQLVMIGGRTQLFGADDMANVRRIQAGYQLRTLSAFTATTPPQPPPKIQWIAPLSPQETRTSPEFFNQLAFLLQFAPVHPSEQHLRDGFARIGVVPGGTIDIAALAPAVRQALADGMADGQKQIDSRRAAATGRADQMFGTREELNNDYIARATAAQVGIGGNSRAEAIYRRYEMDSNDELLDGSRNRYVLRFAKGQLPPVNAFWSVTAYTLPQQLLVRNPKERYLIGSTMLQDLKTDADGGITIHLQKDSPGPALESNWLPVPDGPFMLVLRSYWPQKAMLEYEWSAPKVERVRGGAGAQG
ncbi:DUF1254 domain-containing protein [Lysobacter sp. MMG2]|uniref:DUF1254 domain-containing protein n=1 Tax=Lysobacter sp. MMG2 TaxID=2801338 RepID=UPI001C2479B8|nr:DUF1254 domain-containing protein [Lysobacter sp. MMG2]MBU8974680.1 DUF1254 domain-containing protein [Lysobacter sp. MMG2]